MSFYTMERRFGVTAVEKGFITADELIEAMTIQIREELEQRRHRPIGQILHAMGCLDSNQIRAVLAVLGFKTEFCRTITRHHRSQIALYMPDESLNA